MAACNSPEVTLTSGFRLLGRRSPSGLDIDEFRGIPYGNIPGRWQHSTLRTDLPSNPFDATKNGPLCPQPPEFANTGIYQSHLDFPTDVGESEFDCLNLFVVRPGQDLLSKAGINPGSALPVFVWIHGGGYGFGASTDPPWDPTQLVFRSVELGKPIITVFLNYRLNSFGFLASAEIIAAQDEYAPLRGANFGLGDQFIALEWLSKNIAAFGGDPAKITVGGQSAGGSSAHAQAINGQLAQSQPLFRRVAIHSGAVGTLGPIPLEKASSNFSQVAEILGFAEQTPEAQFKSMLNASPKDLLAATNKLAWWVFPLVNDGFTIKPGKVGRWAVTLGRKSAAETNDDSKKERVIDILVGDADAEGIIMWEAAATYGKDFAKLKDVLEEHLSPGLAEEVMGLYAMNASASPEQLRDSLLQLFTDVEFGLPVQYAREELSSKDFNPASGVWPTQTHSFRFQVGNPWPGPFYNLAQHCIDLIYLFNAFHVDMAKADKEVLAKGELGQIQLVQHIQKIWIDFISDDELSVKPTEDEAIMFERNRAVSIVDMHTDPEWMTREKRFKFLKANGRAMDAATRQIMGMTAV